MIRYVDLQTAVGSLTNAMKLDSLELHPPHWQSIDVSKQPAARMRELVNVAFQVALPNEELQYYRDQLRPNTPWADDHFEQERVSGQPINPGETWKQWPGAHSANKFRREGEAFSHSYAERYWPNFANQTYGGTLPPSNPNVKLHHHQGIRYRYGDLEDVAMLLARDPLTRQAYLPVWFPEDTGVVHGERVPCTLGYHFLMRNAKLHVFYPIRSCDFTLHFRDDLYLTIRLLLWMLERCRAYAPEAWLEIHPGDLTFWAGSLHCFVNAWRTLK